ncbi:MAG: stealth family protein [Rikenellaceae bacterium]
MKIDLVYLWCNGSDPQWRSRREHFVETGAVCDPQAICDGRIADNSDLRYSLRSVELYAPWVNHIYIVTDNQSPDWLDTTNPRISIVNQNDLFDPKYLPLYNSCALELGLHKIEGLSEHYIYANDDMMLGRAVSPEFFFTADGKAKSRFIWSKSFKRCDDTYSHTINRVLDAIVGEYGAKYDFLYPHHQIDPYVKGSVEECLAKYCDWTEETLSHNFRSRDDMQRHIFSLFAVATGRGVVASRFRQQFSRLRQIILMFLGCSKGANSLLIGLESKDIERPVKLLKPALLCFNDSERATEEDRIQIKRIYERLYPRKSQFEL